MPDYLTIDSLNCLAASAEINFFASKLEGLTPILACFGAISTLVGNYCSNSDI